MSDDAALASEIRALEERLLDPAVRRTREDLERLLADAFVEYGSSGRVFDRDAVIAALAAGPSASFAITMFRVQRVGPDAALATYRVTARDAAGVAYASLRSSLWIRAQERWQMLFHQGTPTATQVEASS